MLGLWEWGHGEDYMGPLSRTYPRVSLIFVTWLMLPGSPSWDLCLGQGGPPVVIQTVLGALAYIP